MTDKKVTKTVEHLFEGVQSLHNEADEYYNAQLADFMEKKLVSSRHIINHILDLMEDEEHTMFYENEKDYCIMNQANLECSLKSLKSLRCIIK